MDNITTTVINKHHKLPYQIDIGRGTIWGNPFSHMQETKAKYKVATREEAIQNHKEWVVKQSKLMKRLHELWGLTLGCYCKPLACHGDTLIELINERFKDYKPPYRVIVAGGRDFKDYNLLERKLDKLLENKKETHTIIIVSGKAEGADTLGERYAKRKGYLIQNCPADWKSYGNSAGIRRNADMANMSQACVCFWDGTSHGTKAMIDLATDKGLRLSVVNY